MTQPQQPQQPQTPFDTGNGLLNPTDCVMAVTAVKGPQGERLAVTLRTASTTMTVFLDKASADNWASTLKTAASKMTNLILANGSDLPTLGGGG